MMKYLAILFSAILFGCASPAIQHNTPSGKVEVTIYGVKKPVVKNTITSEMINKGFSVTKSDDLILGFERPVDDYAATMFYGSRYDSTPNLRMNFNLLEEKNAVRVIVDCAMITNPGSAYERRTDANNNPDTAKVSIWLKGVKYKLEKR